MKFVPAFPACSLWFRLNKICFRGSEKKRAPSSCQSSERVRRFFSENSCALSILLVDKSRMKNLTLILSLLCISCSTSYGQILQWTKTITAPLSGASLRYVKSSSKTISSVAVILEWENVDDERDQLIWFGSKGSVIHSELLDGFDGTDYPNYTLYGISSSRLVLIKEIDGADYQNLFLSYNRKGSAVTKTEIDPGTEHDGGRYPDETGFFKFEKGEGDTWIIKRYAF